MNPEQLLLATILAHRASLRGSSLAALLLVRDEPCSLTTVARRIGLTTGAMTGLADQLYLSGYAVRITVDTDRRKQLLKITTKGIETLQCILEK